MTTKEKVLSIYEEHPDWSYSKIGAKANGVSRQRVHQIIRGYRSPSYQKSKKYKLVKGIDGSYTRAILEASS